MQDLLIEDRDVSWTLCSGSWKAGGGVVANEQVGSKGTGKLYQVPAGYPS